MQIILRIHSSTLTAPPTQRLGALSVLSLQGAPHCAEIAYIRRSAWLTNTALIFFGVLGLAAAAQANQTLLDANNGIQVAAGGYNLNYKETLAGSSKLSDTEQGTQAGYQLRVSSQGTVLGVRNFYLSSTIGYATGRTDYNGSLQNRSTGAFTPYQRQTRNQTLDLTMKLGKAFPIGPDAQVVPYIYYADHYWDRDGRDDLYGYDERFKHNGIGVGGLAQYALTSRLVVSVDGSLGTTFGAAMTTGLTSGTFHLGNATVVTGEVGLDYALSQRWHLNATYRITHFNYGQSGFINGYYEPASRTTAQTFVAGIGLVF